MNVIYNLELKVGVLKLTKLQLNTDDCQEKILSLFCASVHC